MSPPTRREFLAASAVGLLSTVGRPHLSAKDESADRITLGYSTYPLPDHSTEEAIELISRTGFDSIELAVVPDRPCSPEKLSPSQRQEIRKRLADNSLRLSSLMEHLPIATDLAGHRQQLERLKLTAQLAHDLSPERPPVIQTILGGKDWGAVREPFLERLADWKKVAEEMETVVAIKPHRGNAMSRPEHAVGLLKELGKSPWLRMCYDYSHFAFRDMPMVETIEVAAPWTAHIAVKDARKVGDRVEFALPGVTGNIDYVTLIREFHSRGYRGDVCVEVSSQLWRQPEYDAGQAMQGSYEKMSAAFREAGISRGG